MAHSIYFIIVLSALVNVSCILELTPKAESVIKRLMTCRHMPGMSLAIVSGMDNLTAGFGIADLETNRAVDIDTLFCIGSVTKSVSVALLTDLLQDEKLNIRNCDWNIKLKDIWKDFESTDHWRTSEMSLKDILSHRTGLESIELGNFAGYPTSITRKELVRRLKYLKELYPFRDRFHYNNLMYMLAGYVAEVIGNSTWEDLINTRLFRKLGMVSSTAFYDTDIKNLSIPYTFDANTKKYSNVMNVTRVTFHPLDPAGSVLTSARDMVKWLKYKIHNVSQCYLEAVQPVVFRENGDTFIKNLFPDLDYSSKLYAMGWGVGTYRGRIIYTHSGDIYGYSAIQVVLPEMQVALHVNSNGPGGSEGFIAMVRIAYYLIDTVIMNIESSVNETNVCTLPDLIDISADEPDPYQTPKDVPNPHSYTGSYGHPIIGDFYIKYLEETDVLQCSLGINLKGVLYKTGINDTFTLLASPPLNDLYEFKNRALKLRFDDKSPNNGDQYQTLNVTVEWATYTFRRGVSFADFNMASGLLISCKMFCTILTINLFIAHLLF
ncbi:hypothetical protein LOTGIDRAFT_165565 [Lottia gigantea]|uniref:Beta-lactamase-related domain-containing protein n=1 Tax=Lottia gigantea TaxID=225164 RepID=V4A0L1_LOTGI|nr:hypothetical protein LOTGIDRAFT_165565 [Lottia gigantea]ESO88440.1 hypothetical protein LOTGIDRAFT_165565 [Lottia gigantea]